MLTAQSLQGFLLSLCFPAGLADLIGSIRAGGVTVETTFRKKPNWIACRTIVQIDGDIVVYVDPSMSASSPEWIEHVGEVQTRISSMSGAIHKTTNTAARILTLLFTSFSLLTGGIWAAQTGNWLGLGGPLILGLAFHLILKRFFPQYVAWTVKHILHFVTKRVKRLTGLELRAEYRVRSRDRHGQQESV